MRIHTYHEFFCNLKKVAVQYLWKVLDLLELQVQMMRRFDFPCCIERLPLGQELGYQSYKRRVIFWIFYHLPRTDKARKIFLENKYLSTKNTEWRSNLLKSNIKIQNSSFHEFLERPRKKFSDIFEIRIKSYVTVSILIEKLRRIKRWKMRSYQLRDQIDKIRIFAWYFYLKCFKIIAECT